MLPIRIILHLTDFSDCSRDAFQVACSLARDYGARLVLLYVAEVPTFAGDGAAIIPAVLDLEPFQPRLNNSSRKMRRYRSNAVCFKEMPRERSLAWRRT